MNRRRLAAFAAVLGVVVAGGILVGPAGLSDPAILWELRLPRVLLGAAIGAALATAGAVLQGLTGNPLADPFLLGASSGAAVGVSLARLIGFPFASLPTFAFAGISAFGALALAWALARTGGRVPVERLVLAGIAVSTLGSALVLLVLHLLGRDAYAILSFLVGNLSQGDRSLLALGGGVCVLGVLALCAFGRPLNAIALGEDKARTLGIDVEATTRWAAVFCAGVVGASVAVAGMVGFVGLVVPHAARALAGPDHRTLLAASGLAGAAFLVLVDTLARTAAAPAELPVGVITALCGAPFFLYVLRKPRPTWTGR